MANHRIRPRILVIDDDENVREDLCAMFEPLGYEVEAVTGSGNALLNNAKSHAGKFRPHVAIVDLRLLLKDDQGDRSGVELLEELGAAYCILYSAYITPEISRQLANVKTANWAGKEEDPQTLVDLVNSAARDASASQKNFRIDKNSVSFKQIGYDILGKDTDVPPYLIEDILCQLFPDAPGVHVETLEGSVKTPTSVHRGHSAILRVKRKDKIEPLVVKIASKEDISREYKNYKNFIEGNLKGSFNAILTGEPRIFWELGAVVYSFLGSSQGMSEFSKFYKKEHDSDVILRPLQTFFEEVWHGLYARRSKEISVPLYSAYDGFLKLQKRLTNFLDQTEYRAFQGLDIKLLNPVTWVLKHKTDSKGLNAYQAITHGDLHGDNIFVDGTHAWVIDFERSGLGHVLRDFTELEMDIVTRLAWKKDDKDLKEPFLLITHLADPCYLRKGGEPEEIFRNAESRKAFNVISGLRRIAQDITKFSDFREYIWSLLFDAVFVASHTAEGDAQHERALLYGSVLCSRLKQWGKIWPPEEWKSVLASIQSGAITSAETASFVVANNKPDSSAQVTESKVTIQTTITSHLPSAEGGSSKFAPSSNSTTDFVLVTALLEERDALLAKLPGHRRLRPNEDDIRTYFRADLPVVFPDNSTGKYRVVVTCLLGMGRVQAATTTADAIRIWHPRYILLVGIAGGIAARNVRIGDVLISDQIVDYELQKLTPQGPEIRWDVQRADPRLLDACNSYRSEDWQESIREPRPEEGRPQRHTGPIASGDKVIAFDEVLKRYRDVWTKLIGVEMEAAGVATAAFQSTARPGFFMVRGVSDLADENKDATDVRKWRKYACDIAASYTMAWLKSGPIPLTDDSASLKTK